MLEVEPVLPEEFACGVSPAQRAAEVLLSGVLEKFRVLTSLKSLKEERNHLQD